jgi:hypothetical protein
MCFIFFSWWRVPQRAYGGMLVFVSERTIKDIIIIMADSGAHWQ